MSGRLAEIEARLDAATLGPWRSAGYDDHPGDRGWWVHNGGAGMAEYAVVVTYEGNPRAEADHDLIAAAPTDLRDLLAVAKAARDYMTASESEGGAEYAYHLGLALCALRAALADLDRFVNERTGS